MPRTLVRSERRYGRALYYDCEMPMEIEAAHVEHATQLILGPHATGSRRVLHRVPASVHAGGCRYSIKRGVIDLIRHIPADALEALTVIDVALVEVESRRKDLLVARRAALEDAYVRGEKLRACRHLRRALVVPREEETAD